MANKEFGLGGVDSLLGSIDMTQDDSSFIANLPEGITADSEGVLWIDPARLKPNPQQPRTEFDQNQLQELADSIKEHGILQPITIEAAENGDFYIIAGERRTRAALLAGLNKVPVQLRHFSEEGKLVMALIENIQRADLNPVEEAQAYYNLMQLGGLTQEEVAKRVGKNRSTVANALRLLKLPSDMLSALSSGKISAGHARALLSISRESDQRELFGRIIGSEISVREAEYFASEVNSNASSKKKDSPKKPVTRDPNLIDIETKFIQLLGTKVSIKGTLDRGSVQIEFFSKEDLDRLYNVIHGKQDLHS